jgi:mycothiol system anti-sigma-R factor
MDCEQVLTRLWEYLDRELEPGDSASIEVHLHDCPRCHPAYCFDRAFLRLLARQRDSCSAPLSLRLWARRLPH